VSLLASKNSQNPVYRQEWPHRVVINHNGSPTIVDTPLTVIFKMGQRAFHILFCLKRKPILCLRLCATSGTADYSRYMTKNRWRSVDAHFHDLAGSFSPSVLPVKATNTSFMTMCNHSSRRLPKIRDQESLTLRWHSCSWSGRERFTFCIACKASQYIVYNYMQPITLQKT
jgi:hypothetical protein